MFPLHHPLLFIVFTSLACVRLLLSRYTVLLANNTFARAIRIVFTWTSFNKNHDEQQYGPSSTGRNYQCDCDENQRRGRREEQQALQDTDDFLFSPPQARRLTIQVQGLFP